MSNWSHFKDGIEYEDIRKFFLNKCKELGLKSKYRNGEINFEDYDSYDYFMGEFSDDGVLSIYYPFTLKKEYFMSNFEDYDEFLAQFMDVYDSAMVEKRLRKTESSKKSTTKSLKESIDVKIVYWDDTPSDYIDDVTRNDLIEFENDANVYKIIDVTNGKKKTIFLNESKKSACKSRKSKKSMTEKMLQDICNSWIIGNVKGEFKGRDYCHPTQSYSLYNIGNIIEDALRDNYVIEFDGDDKTKTVIFNLINSDGKEVGSLEIYPDEAYSIENYEDGFEWDDLNMKEIIQHFEEMLGYKIEYLKKDKRFDYSDRFWYESKKSARKSLTEKNTVNYWDKLHNIIPLDTRDESYRFATMCVTNLYNDDEYDSEDALIYFIDCYLSDKYPSWEDEFDMEEVATMLYKGKMKWKDIDKSWFESKKSAKKSMKESFDDDLLVIDVIDMMILNFGYDKKTVEKYFYKIHKLNDFDTISLDEYIKIKEEIEKALGYDIFQ